MIDNALQPMAQPQMMLPAPAGMPAERKSMSADEIARKDRLFRAYEANKSHEMDESREARRYYHGKHWTDKELQVLKQRKQPIVTDNRISRKVDFLVGVEQRMRRDPKAFPRTPNEEEGAGTATACIRYGCDVNRWEHKASDATHDGLVSGFGVIWVGVDNRGGSPDVFLRPVDVDRWFYDPRSTKADFSDARYMGVHLWLDIEEAKERWPRAAADLARMMDAVSRGTSALRAEQDRATQWADFEHQRVRIIEMWERRGKGWYYCFFSGELDLESGDSPYMDAEGNPDCPYYAWSPYIDEKGTRYGVVRNMRPLQDEVNHRRSKFLHMINVRQVYTREGEVSDIDEMRNELSRPDGIVKHNGEWGKTTGIIDQSQQIQGQVQLLTEATAALENLGPNPGLIGKGGGIADQSGRAILAQRDSGMTELSPVFERLRDWKLRVYRAIWGRIRSAWTGERFIRVTDNENSLKFLPVNSFQENEFGELVVQNQLAAIDVDIILEEGPDSITMQEEEFDALTKMVQAGLPIPPAVIIKASSLRNKQELLEAIAPPQQPNPMEEAELEKMHADIGLTKANAIAALAKADQLDMQAGNLGTPGQPVVMPEIMTAAPGVMPMAPEEMTPDQMGGDLGMMDEGLPPDGSELAPVGALPIRDNPLLRGLAGQTGGSPIVGA